jgi:hypothetical protein
MRDRWALPARSVPRALAPSSHGVGAIGASLLSPAAGPWHRTRPTADALQPARRLDVRAAADAGHRASPSLVVLGGPAGQLRAPGQPRATSAEPCAFVGGMLAIAFALLSGIDRYDTTLFSIHMVQHVC